MKKKEEKKKEEDDCVNKVCTTTWETRKMSVALRKLQSCGWLFLTTTKVQVLSVRTDVTCQITSIRLLIQKNFLSSLSFYFYFLLPLL